MSKIYKNSFNIYRAILIITAPIFLVGNFLVGLGGHNSELKITDYLILGFTIITPILLTVFIKIDNDKITIRNTFRIAIMGLVTLSIASLFYGLYDSWLLYQDQNFGIGDNIPVAIIIFLIALSSLLLVGLAKNRI
jgi:hypothetical protein